MVALLLALIVVRVLQPQPVSKEDYSLIDSHLQPPSAVCLPLPSSVDASYRGYVSEPAVPLLAAPGGDTLGVLSQGAPVLGCAPEGGFRHVVTYGLVQVFNLACEREPGGDLAGGQKYPDLARAPSGAGGIVVGITLRPTIESHLASYTRQCTTKAVTTLYHPNGLAVWDGQLFRTAICVARVGTVVHIKSGKYPQAPVAMLAGWIPETSVTTRLHSISFPAANSVLGPLVSFVDRGDSVSVRIRCTPSPGQPALPDQELELLGPGGEELWRGEAAFLPAADQPSTLRKAHLLATIPAPADIIASCRIRAGDHRE